MIWDIQQKSKTVSCRTKVLSPCHEKSKGVPAGNGMEKWIETHFDDSRLELIYPNANKV